MSEAWLKRVFLISAWAGLFCVGTFGQSASYKVIHSFSGYPNDIEQSAIPWRRRCLLSFHPAPWKGETVDGNKPNGV